VQAWVPTVPASTEARWKRGADSAIVAGLMKECEAARMTAEAALRETVYKVPLGVDEIRALVAFGAAQSDQSVRGNPEAGKAIYQGLDL
jgi:hypothetical protein